MVQTSNGLLLALGFLDGACLGSCAVLCLPASITACCSARGPKCGRRSGFPAHGALIWLQLPHCLLAHPLESPLHVHLEELQHQRESGSGRVGESRWGHSNGHFQDIGWVRRAPAAAQWALQQQEVGHEIWIRIMGEFGA